MHLYLLYSLCVCVCACVCVGESTVLHDMLANRHLVRIICHLDTVPWPDLHLEAAMHEPIFTEFVDECLRVVEPQQPV